MSKSIAQTAPFAILSLMVFTASASAADHGATVFAETCSACHLESMSAEATETADNLAAPPMNLLTGIEGVREGVLLGIRPEHLRVADSGGWQLHVQTVEMLGAERLIYGHLNGPQGPWTILRMNETEAPPAPGQQLHVLPLEDRIHGFDAATGLRIEA